MTTFTPENRHEVEMVLSETANPMYCSTCGLELDEIGRCNSCTEDLFDGLDRDSMEVFMESADERFAPEEGFSCQY